MSAVAANLEGIKCIIKYMTKKRTCGQCDVESVIHVYKKGVLTTWHRALSSDSLYHCTSVHILELNNIRRLGSK